MNRADNLEPASAQMQEQERSADILAFAHIKRLPPGPQPYPPSAQDQWAYTRVTAWAKRNTEQLREEEIERRKNDPPGSVGAAKVPQPEVVWNRVVIEIRIGETERAVDEVQDALINSDRGLYRRGGLIVSTGFDKMQTWDGRSIEVQIIEERSNYALLEDIEAVASFERYNPKTEKRMKVPPPMALANTLKQRTNRLRLPNLVSVINCPTIKADGELITEPGFYPDIGILYDPRGVKFPLPPPQPGKAVAMTALARITRLINTFDFVSADDKAVALSLILTAVARPCLPTAPLHGFDAPVAGSGKSKLVDIASILATGHEAGVVAQGETREEAEKRFSTLLMRGDLIIAIDNCEGPLEGVVFNQALTQSWANLRILGQSKAIRVRCAAMITATGNNLIIKGDLTRRSVVCRLDPESRAAGAKAIYLRPHRRRQGPSRRACGGRHHHPARLPRRWTPEPAAPASELRDVVRHRARRARMARRWRPGRDYGPVAQGRPGSIQPDRRSFDMALGVRRTASHRARGYRGDRVPQRTARVGGEAEGATRRPKLGGGARRQDRQPRPWQLARSQGR